MKKKVFVGFSGGVDSAVSAFLLTKKYDVTAVMFRNTHNEQCNKVAEEEAKSIAKHIGIPLEIVDFQENFEKSVISPFIKSYKEGKTPNPCVNCNIKFKFGIFANWCFDNGADLIATGHYCKTKDGKLFRGRDRGKDQSYFLSGISEDILRRTIFPIGNMTKEMVRKQAQSLSLPNMSKKDSQEVCFIDTSLSEYLDEHIINKEGDIIDIDTKEVVGRHSGIHSLTLGQRRGILVGGSDLPYFVAKKDISTNTIFVAKGKYNPYLWKDTFILKDFSFINKENINITKGLTGVVRYRARGSRCSVDWDSKTIVFKGKVWTPSIGQSLVLYKRQECIGGGVIKEIF
ncbi:tRNA 2-thiouridine(34) synthase MnmA [bacterium]|nr:tRNA 2-thiouridine(34) synthase MnmA [bacterium]